MPISAVLSLSILIAGIIAAIRFNKIDRVYYPFVICIWIASLNELFGFIFITMGHYTTINNNVYVLLESILFLYFFRNLGLFKEKRTLFIILIAGLIVLWTWENFILGRITYVSSWFRIVSSFLIVFMSITLISRLIVSDVHKPIELNASNIFKNPVLLICIGSIAYFTFKVLVEIFWLQGLNYGKEFRIKIYHILVYINFVVNLIYALAILWVHPKQQSIARY
jgi:hypothetical protein